MPIIRMITLCLFLSITGYSGLYALEPANPRQPGPVREILDNEHNEAHRKEIISIINYIDTTYNDLHQKLRKGGKLTVFFDPAHGLLPDGRWQGGRATGRQSSSGIPEEYYSILLSRELYRLLDKNRFIEIGTTEDFRKVMEGEARRYIRITFSDTIRYARDSGAFIIISQHLNNISSIHKAAGRVAMRGIHLTHDSMERPVLINIRSVHSGFLTLYSQYDAGGFSRRYAEILKEELISKGLTPNSWGNGIVPDNRFTYFTDFPVSVMFESGFISNPREEALLKSPAYRKTIVKAQYDSLLKAVREIFGVDISGRGARRIKPQDEQVILNMKLSRIAVYYIRSLETAKAVQAIEALENSNAGTSPEIRYYSNLKKRLERFENDFTSGMKTLSKNKTASEQLLASARDSIQGSVVLSRYREYYSDKLPSPAEPDEKKPDEKREYIPEIITGALRELPVIMTVAPGQTLENAVFRALRPNMGTLPILVDEISRAFRSEGVFKKENNQPVEGIYIINLKRDLTVSGLKKVDSVILDPHEYQNQLYLKNSHFTGREKQRGT